MSQVFPHLHVVLLCEDYGERLWPVAREQAPACFTSIGPDSSETLLTAAIERGRAYTQYPLHVVTTPQLAPAIHDMLNSQVHLKDSDFELLMQPVRRGSAVSIALASARIRRMDPQAVVLVLRTDQRMVMDDRWERTLFRAYQVALNDKIVVLGGEQKEKCAEYTYVRKGKPLPDMDGAYEVRLFSANQPPAAARRICDQGGYWYTGVMMARAAVILGELALVGESGQTPDTYSSHRIAETANFLAMLEPTEWLRAEAQDVIEALPATSYEKAALECSRKLVVIPTTIEFLTVANLDDLDALEPANRQGNRNIGTSTTAINCKNTTLFSQEDGRQVVAYGLEGALVVDTPDALLVTTKDNLTKMGDLFVGMRGADVPQLRKAARRPFGWGVATLLENSNGHATWRIELRPDCTMNLLSIPFAFEVFEEPSFKEQYVLLEGNVYLGRGSGRDCQAGDAFEAQMPHSWQVANRGEGVAVLLMVAVAQQQ